MKPGDRVRVREVLPVEWPVGCTPRETVKTTADYCRAEGAPDPFVVGTDRKGRVLLALPSRGAAPAYCWEKDSDGEYLLPCPLVPAAALEPVAPPLPGGWEVERRGHRVTLHTPGLSRVVARVDGGVLTLCTVSCGAPADPLAALAHLVAVPEVTRD